MFMLVFVNLSVNRNVPFVTLSVTQCAYDGNYGDGKGEETSPHYPTGPSIPQEIFRRFRILSP